MIQSEYTDLVQLNLFDGNRLLDKQSFDVN